MDWDKGLPMGVLTLVAQAGGIEHMKMMRNVSKTWKAEFEMGVARLKVVLDSPSLPWGAAAAQRFPLLISLDISESCIEEEWMENLGSFKKLKRLVLGSYKEEDGWSPHAHNRSLAVRLSDEGMAHLRGLPLTNLGLGCFNSVTDFGMQSLHGMPLTELDLSMCNGVTLSEIHDLPLTRLRMVNQIWKMASTDVGYLEKMPLTDLDLDGSGLSLPMSEFLECIKRLPLTSLSLPFARSDSLLTDDDLDFLAHFPLTHLGLKGAGKISDVGLEKLRGLQLTSLDLQWCSDDVTDTGLRCLRGMPLERLNLKHCGRGLYGANVEFLALQNAWDEWAKTRHIWM